MKGCRPLTQEEATAVSGAFIGRYGLRDRALFTLGLKSGFRISELLSVRVCDVWDGEQVLDRLHVGRRNMKKKIEGRTVPLHAEAKAALAIWLTAYLKRNPGLDPAAPVFPGTLHGLKALTRVAAWRVLKQAYRQAGLSGPGLASHCMRKTFASRVFEALDRDLFRTQKALGHRSPASTCSYLSFNEHEVEHAILAS